MKAEERHELKENTLKSWLQYGFPIWLKQNGSYLLLAAALVILSIQLWRMYTQRQEMKMQSALSDLLKAERPDAEHRTVQLQGIIDQYDFKPIRALALRDLGNAFLDSVARGTADDDKPVDKEDALNRAQEAFDQVLKEYPDQRLAVAGAKIGLAVVAEDRGEWDKARKAYEELTGKGSAFAGTAVALDAAAKLQALGKVQASPRLAALLPPPSTRPGTLPGNLLGPDSFLPSGFLSPSAEAQPATMPRATAPAGPLAPPATIPATMPSK